jgi:hypothetical protein
MIPTRRVIVGNGALAQIHETLLSRIPHCEEATVDRPSHLLQIDEPLVVAEAISSFLAR